MSRKEVATDWTAEVQRLVVHGRDREAAGLAAEHLSTDHDDTNHDDTNHDDTNHDDTDHVTSPEGEQSMGPVQQIEELAPLLGQVASRLTPSDLDAPTPCSAFTVRGVLGHMIGGATQFAAAFRGTTPPEVPADVADGPDVVERAGATLQELVAAIGAPGALDRSIASPFGELPGETFARFVVLDGLVHGWDLAMATGQPYDPPDQLVADAEAFARQAIREPMRDGDTFAAELAAPAAASPIERLVAFTGRAPFHRVTGQATTT